MILEHIYLLKTMKKIYLALVCLAGLSIVMACGGKKDSAPKTGNEKVDEIIEKAFADMSGIEKFQSVLKEHYQLDLKDVAPGFEFPEKNAKGSDYFYGDKDMNHRVVCMFAKTDGSDISKDEYRAYVKKVYDLMATKAQDGKLIKGFDGGAETLEDALQEKTFDQLFASEFWPQEFCYRMNNAFYVCSMSLENAKGEIPMRIKFETAQGLQKSFSETWSDAEEALDDPEVQKAIKDAIGQ